MSNISIENRDRFVRAEREAAREGQREADAESSDLLARLAVANGGEPVGKEPEEAEEAPSEILTSEEAIQDANYDFEEVTKRIKDDPLYARALANELRAASQFPKPYWYAADGLFSANLNFGGGNCVRINAATFGSRGDAITRNTRLIQIQAELSRLGEEIQAVEGKTDAEKLSNAPVDLIRKRSDKINQITTIQSIELYGSMIESWEGPIFTDPSTNKPYQLLSSLSTADDEQLREATRIIRRIPAKAMDMIKDGFEILSREGLEDEWAQGNS